MRRKLFTIGYTGYSISDFVATLREHGVECLLDIRELPVSRKAGFSKSSLRQHLEEAGIEYHHLRWLGSPRALRHEVRESGDYVHFFSGVHDHLECTESAEELLEAVRLARKRRSCLMCCCPDWQFCHRKCVVEAIQSRAAFAIDHIQQGHVGRRAA